MTSIRRRLILTLFVLWTSVWAAVVYTSFDRSRHEVEELLDAQLAQIGNVLRQIALGGNLSQLLKGPQTLMPIGHPYESKISFQLWCGDALLGSFGAAPAEALGHQPGFSDRMIGETTWRVFGIPGLTTDEVLYVAQSYDIRNELIEFLTLQAMRPILWSLPLSVLLIWLAVSDGLRPLRDLASAIGRRSSERLDPIDPRQVPAEIRPLADALNALMQRLERALSAERHFAADASHELRSPFSAIRAHAQIALRSKDSGERADALQELMRGIDRATELIEQLLTLSRLSAAEEQPSSQLGSLTDAVEQAIQEMAQAAQAKQIALRQYAPASDSRLVAAAPSALAVLVHNLIENAIKFTPVGGQVEVRLLEQDPSIVLEVLDTGRGIASSERERVFDRFYRPPGQDEPGSGLGLAVVRRICQRHHAEITLNDNPTGSGLCVRVRFPQAG